VLLADQDRALWDRAQIEAGIELARGALRARGALAPSAPGPYALQAAIAAEHCRAAAAADTDWLRIRTLYDWLALVQPSPVVELNRAVAVSFAEGPAAGLAVVDAVADDPRLARTHRLPATRADLLRRLGRSGEAADAYRAALPLAGTAPERAFLQRRLAEVESPA